MQAPIRVAMVDDHEFLLDGMRIAIGQRPDFEIVLAVGSVEEFVAGVAGRQIDVVLTDLALPDGSGADIAAYCADAALAPVLLTTGQSDLVGIQVAIESGCVGFVSKVSSLDVLCEALHVAAAGGTVYPSALLRAAASRPKPVDRGITRRELVVLGMLADGRSATAIAEELVVSIHTVRNHIRSLLTKFDATSQLEAVVRAVREGLVVIEPDGAPEQP